MTDDQGASREPRPAHEPERPVGTAGTGETDAAGVAEERAQALAALTEVQGDLAAVDRALAALDEGTYGICEVCAEPIADEALAASPVARTCGAHDAAAEAPAPAGPA